MKYICINKDEQQIGDNNFNKKQKLQEQMISQQQGNTIRILEYRNGIYQGQTKNNKRNGHGILITDDNLIIVGEWKNDVMSGRALVFINPEHYGFGDFNRGEIQGNFIFRNKGRTLFSQYNMSRPINKMLLLNHETQKCQTLIHKTPIFETLQQKPLPQNTPQSTIIKSQLQKSFPILTLLQYLQQQLCTACPFYSLKSLPNGNLLFYFNDATNPLSLGFCLNKNQILASFGMYIGEKINGFGCKYENSVRYEGMFVGGFVHGVGLKCMQGKYSFGSYENGNLVQAMYIDDRSNICEEKLQEVKKMYHLRSIWYENSYIRKNILKFKGFDQLVFQINSQQQYMYPQIANLLNSPTKKPNPPQSQKQSPYQPQYSTRLPISSPNRNQFLFSSNQIGSKNSPSKNIAFNMLLKRQGDKLQTKSSKQYIGRLNESGVRNEGSVLGNGGINTKTTIQKGRDRNPEDIDDLIDQGRSSTGLRNLRKFNH